MSKENNLTDYLTDLGDAIREVGGGYYKDKPAGLRGQNTRVARARRRRPRMA